jgi:DNA (cytosine-5)-methyltransferase 1
MTTREPYRLLDLFSGIGGFSLGLERTGGFKTVAFCEIEPFPRKVLAKHWPEVPIYDDVRNLSASRLAADGIAVDAICGGFPCQDISVAGRRAGIAGKRSGLWEEYARLICELGPRVVIMENVAELLGRGIGEVLGTLSDIGYDAEWHSISAYDCGAPHIRDRIWIIAYCDEIGRSGSSLDIEGPFYNRHQWPPEIAKKKWKRVLSWLESRSASHLWQEANPAHCGMDDGISDRLDRIGACGNAVIPQIPEMIGRAILASDGRA